MNFPYRFSRTRVKICGFTQSQNAIEAARLGVDAIGLVFYKKSPRAVTIQQAQHIVSVLPPFVTVVGLFVDERASYIREVLGKCTIDVIQFHGDESPEFCKRFDMPYIKAIAVKDQVGLVDAATQYCGALGLLLDAWHPELKGGAGLSFDWKKIPLRFETPIILAGGLTPENVQQAIASVRPFAVDVSSGVESEKGVKDAKKMAAFLDEVYKFDHAKCNDE